MLRIDYLEVVQQALTHEWTGKPIQAQQKSLNAAIEIFAKVAFKNVVKEGGVDFSVKRVKSDLNEEQCGTLNLFVRQHATWFKEVCETGFSFDKADRKASKIALKDSLESHRSFYYRYMLLRGNLISSHEIENLSFSEVETVCHELKHEMNNELGLSLLWLIKVKCGCQFEIPPLDDYQNGAAVLNSFLDCNPVVEHPAKFIEFLLSKRFDSQYPLYHYLLDKDGIQTFSTYLMTMLKEIPMADWPNKVKFIKSFLITNPEPFARELCTSTDSPTKAFAHHLLGALTSPVLSEKISHLNYIIDRGSEYFYPRICESLFGFYYPSLRSNNQNDPAYFYRLNFNSGEVVVADNIILGTYDHTMYACGSEKTPYIYAYDLGTEKMLWAFPLPQSEVALRESGSYVPRLYETKKIGTNVFLRYLNDNRLILLSPITGEVDATLALPQPFMTTDDDFHYTEGTVYQFLHTSSSNHVHRASLVEGVWQNNYTAEVVNFNLLPLSTHCGFHDTLGKRILQIIGPSGNEVRFENCLKVFADGKKLFLVKKDPTDKCKSILVVHTLLTDERVISEEELSLTLDSVNVQFIGICTSGKLVLDLSKKLVFIDLITGTSKSISHQVPEFGSYYLQRDKEEVWAWEGWTENSNLWRISEDRGAVVVGPLQGRLGATTIWHVDDRDQVYFTSR